MNTTPGKNQNNPQKNQGDMKDDQSKTEKAPDGKSTHDGMKGSSRDGHNQGQRTPAGQPGGKDVSSHAKASETDSDDQGDQAKQGEQSSKRN